MADITIPVIVGKDRRLVINVPEEIPLGPAEIAIHSKENLETSTSNPAREATRAKLLAADFLVTDFGTTEDNEPISEEELEALGRLTPGVRPSEELIDEDRGLYFIDHVFHRYQRAQQIWRRSDITFMTAILLA
jgi:hypothetical protein